MTADGHTRFWKLLLMGGSGADPETQPRSLQSGTRCRPTCPEAAVRAAAGRPRVCGPSPPGPPVTTGFTLSGAAEQTPSPPAPQGQQAARPGFLSSLHGPLVRAAFVFPYLMQGYLGRSVHSEM